MQVYTTEDALRYNTCWDTQNDMLTINLGGKDYTASVADWTYTISGEKINIKDADGNTSEFSAGAADDNATERFQILAALESAALDRYELLPLIDDNAATLYAMKLKLYSEEYIFGVAYQFRGMPSGLHPFQRGHRGLGVCCAVVLRGSA